MRLNLRRDSRASAMMTRLFHFAEAWLIYVGQTLLSASGNNILITFTWLAGGSKLRSLTCGEDAGVRSSPQMHLEKKIDVQAEIHLWSRICSAKKGVDCTKMSTVIVGVDDDGTQIWLPVVSKQWLMDSTDKPPQSRSLSGTTLGKVPCLFSCRRRHPYQRRTRR